MNDEQSIKNFIHGTKEVWFDLDGTLVLANPLRLRIMFIIHYFRVMAPYWGFKRSLVLLRAMRFSLEKQSGGINLERMSARISEKMKVSLREAKDVFQCGTTHIFESLAKVFRRAEGAFDTIAAAHGLGPVVLATNPVWPRNIAELRLKVTGLTHNMFDFITSAENMSSVKPSLDYYQELLQKRKRSPSEILLIGNDFRKDAVATELGIKTFIVRENQTVKIEKLLAIGGLGDITRAMSTCMEQRETQE